MNLWPHQRRGISETLAAIARGERLICLTSPTGGGKTAMMMGLADHYLDDGKRVVAYTNRKMLVEQISRVLDGAGFLHGVRAAGHDDNRHRDFQISSIQTEGARVLRSKRWQQLHDADLVLIDEAHLQKSGTALQIINAHAGATVVGLTATPLGLSRVYTHMVQAGTVSELRACGALVVCHHYGPDEPDLRHIGPIALGKDLSEPQARRAMMVPSIFGRVHDWWTRLNPDGKPTILFAPDVAGSVFFAEQFHARGISAAHIDGNEVWLDGRMYRSSKDGREDILGRSKDGKCRVVCNRFVLREGIDAPWLCHGIFATVFGSLQSYLQSGGRLLRAHPELRHVVLQDHGGNWWRHGSLNSDREWRLEFTDRSVAGARQDSFVNPPPGERLTPQPASCPHCRAILVGWRCRLCGFEIQPGTKSRLVYQEDGTALELTGDPFRPRRICTSPDGPYLWERMYWRSRRTGRTFRAAAALYAQENDWRWPDRSWPFMPMDPIHWSRRVRDVEMERLTPKC